MAIFGQGSVWRRLQTDADPERFRRYGDYKAFYRGEQWVGIPPRRERWLTLNYVKTILVKTTEGVLGGRKFVVDGVGKRSELAAEQLLADVAEQNNLEAIDFIAELTTAVKGDGAFKVTWDPVRQQIVVRSPDVGSLLAWHAPDDNRTLIRVATCHTISGADAARLYGVATIARIVQVVEDWTDATYRVWVDNRLAIDDRNPYGFLPFVVFPNIEEPDEFWGESDVKNLMEPQRELNRSFTQLSRIMELSGNPITVLEGVEKGEDIAIGPGAVWTLPEESKAYLLDLLEHGGVGLHIDYLNAVYKALHDLGETPRTAFGDTGRSASVSGVALEIELQPLIQRVERKRLVRSWVYRKRAEMIFELARKYLGKKVGAGAKVRIVWGTVTPRDLSREVDDARLLIASGLASRQSKMDELGVADSAAEYKKWIAEEKEIAEVQGTSPGLDSQAPARRD